MSAPFHLALANEVGSAFDLLDFGLANEVGSAFDLLDFALANEVGSAFDLLELMQVRQLLGKLFDRKFPHRHN